MPKAFKARLKGISITEALYSSDEFMAHNNTDYQVDNLLEG